MLVVNDGNDGGDNDDGDNDDGDDDGDGNDGDTDNCTIVLLDNKLPFLAGFQPPS